ncbi:OLC1v1001766C1 [Oldenlandia corymbosa var. corymbosa]|uniref:Glycosyltransferase n=1 Tax=Oldenlandia corymbosa var. corymbosa TaxID=529605 RepID=A0AAV1D8Y1_OLDCO|nr:OLC1v1001766C1 [Oldenlandia corymbosa var. corymbosa]
MPSSRMAESKNAELVLIPAAGVSHLVPFVELANLLITQTNDLSITILIMAPPSDTKILSYKKSLEESSDPRIKFVDLKPELTDDPSKTPPAGIHFFFQFVDNHKPHVRKILSEKNDSSTSKLAGVVADMFCTTFFDVAAKLGVPHYVFFTCGASMFGLMLHLQSLRDDHNVDVTEFKISDKSTKIRVPTYINPVPVRVIPSVFLEKGCSDLFLDQAKRYRKANGIIINTFKEMEIQAIEALSNDSKIPPVYAIGPLLNLKGGKWNDNNQKKKQKEEEDEQSIIKWLDLQPESSVVFLCFGSGGAFDGEQVKEMAKGIERSGYRFLWSLRKPPSSDNFGYADDYENLEDVLPEGFLQRNSGAGKIIGWAPQAAILSHPAVGGFVSHCGWNSILESVWFGMPVATWPLYAEQQVNAFLLVKELEMAVEIKMDYRKHTRETPELSSEDVSAELMERGIRLVMEAVSEVRKKVKQMQVKSLSVYEEEGGSSYTSVKYFIDDVISNAL